MAKFIENKSKGIICFETKNFIPGDDPVKVTEEEVTHPMIVAYIEAGKLVLTEKEDVTSIDDMNATQLKAYAAEKGIELGAAKAKTDILAVIKAAEAGE